MPFLLPILLILVPLVELALLIKLGQWIGFWPTIGIVVATALIGSAMLHRQGVTAYARAMEAMSAGRPPVEPVVDGLFIVIAATFLLTPGVLTDLFGAALLIPPVRRAIAGWVIRRFMTRGWVQFHVYKTEPRGTPHTRGADARETPHTRGADARGPARGDHGGNGPVIDGDYQRVDDPRAGRRDDS